MERGNSGHLVAAFLVLRREGKSDKLYVVDLGQKHSIVHDL
jgi:hypothetical protein